MNFSAKLVARACDVHPDGASNDTICHFTESDLLALSYLRFDCWPAIDSDGRSGWAKRRPPQT
jgi:hypothetical protein